MYITEIPHGSARMVSEKWTQYERVQQPHAEPALQDPAYLDALKQIANLGNLREGWDSYGANRIDEKARSNAVAFIAMLAPRLLPPVPPPVVGPTPDGGVVLRWEPVGGEVMVKLLARGGEYYVAKRDEDKVLEEGEVGHLESLAEAIARFLRFLST